MLYLLLCILLFIQNSFAVENVINLELGELHPLKQNVSKVWIENKRNIDIKKIKGRYVVKTLKLGVSHLRINDELFKVRVLAVGSHQRFSAWSNYIKNSEEFRVDYCEHLLCLKGNLNQTSDYTKIMTYMELDSSYIHLSLKVAPSIASELQKTISEKLRSKGITPQKVLFLSPWKIFYSKTKFDDNALNELGLTQELQKNMTEIADNIKVSVKVVEVSKNFERKVGLHWPDGYQAQILKQSQIAWAESFDVALSAAEKTGDAKILASPNLICRNGKEADFFAGGEFPIKVVNTRSRDVIWKRYGIGLKLKPIIDPIGQMSLQIESEVSTLDRSIVIDDIPALHSNRVSSYFDLIESQTIALSGLIKNELSENSEGLPFLKNIPILGLLFSSKNFQENKSELVIFVTPELMKGS